MNENDDPPRDEPLYDMHLPQRHLLIFSAICLLSPWVGLGSAGVARAEENVARAEETEQPVEKRWGAEEHPVPYPVCSEKPSEAQIEGAKGAYQAGTVSFQEADYERAILYWEDALRRDCTATKLLLNLARAYELAGEKEHAILALETFIERRPESSDRASIEKRIQFLRVDLERERLDRAEAEARSRRTSSEQPGDTGPSRARRPAWPVVVTSTGVVASAVGLSLFFHGQATTDQDLQAAGTALCIAGATVALGGGLAWYLSWKSPKGHAARLTPVAGPGLVGVLIDAKF
jgi:tetratricopeptide (TPR) repeat protein